MKVFGPRRRVWFGPRGLLLHWPVGGGGSVPPIAASKMWEEWWVRQNGVSRAEAQMRVVVDEACGDDDSGRGLVLVVDAPGVSPQSLEKVGTLKESALDPYRNPE